MKLSRSGGETKEEEIRSLWERAGREGPGVC